MATFKIYLWLSLVAKDSVMECTNNNLTWNYNPHPIFSKWVYFSSCVLGLNGGGADKTHKLNKYTYKIKYMTWKGSSLKDGAIYTSDLRLLYSLLLNDGLYPTPPTPFWAQPLLEACSGSPLRHLCVCLSCLFLLLLTTQAQLHRTGDSPWTAYPAPVKSSTN